MSKEKIIQEVADKYHHLLRKNNFFPDYNQELEFYDETNKENSKPNDWKKYILNVETSYFAMPYHLRKIIKSDFFYQNYSFWWEEFYTRKQYKRYREEAINTFYGNLIKTNVLDKDGKIIAVKEPLSPQAKQPQPKKVVVESKYDKFGKVADKILFDEKRLGILVMKSLPERKEEYRKIIVEELKRLSFGEIKEHLDKKDVDAYKQSLYGDGTRDFTEHQEWVILEEHTDILKLNDRSLSDAEFEFYNDFELCVEKVLNETINDLNKAKHKDKEISR